MKRRLCNKATLIVIVAFSLLLALVPNGVQAEPPALPPRPPLPSGGGGGGDADSLTGAIIELTVLGAPAGAWAVVQWQDSTGGWHDVEGWRSMLGESGTKRWWVAPRDFGTGPFQWVIAQGTEGTQLAVSEPFTLPASANQTLQISLSLAQ